MKKLLITIDGPAGAGKTTVSRALAARLGYDYVDTGALYRGMAHAARRHGIAPDDDPGLARMLAGLTLEFRAGPGGSLLLADGGDISAEIRTPEISMLASAISARPVVRAHLLGVQRRLGRGKGAVFEGRDMGTVVFPEADVKFFLDATEQARAARRCAELQGSHMADLAAVQRDMQRRDEQDRTRALAPLRPAEDAIMIDSTGLTVEEVIACMLAHIQEVSGRPA
jgi:cytidylate kinase